MPIQAPSQELYKLPTTYTSLRIHEGTESMPQDGESVPDWFDRNMYGTRADLIGFRTGEVEEALAAGEVEAMPWPLGERRTDFFWQNSDRAAEALSQLATAATDICLGKAEEEAPNGNFQSIAQIMGEGQAVAGLAFAINLGMVREEPDSDLGRGHLYVAELSPYNAEDRGVGQDSPYYRIGGPVSEWHGPADSLLEEARSAQEERAI